MNDPIGVVSLIVKCLCSFSIVFMAIKYGEYCAKGDHLIALIVSTAIAITLIFDSNIISISMK